MKTDTGKLRVDFETYRSKMRVQGEPVYAYRIYCSEGRTLKRGWPFRDKTEADNAALDVIRAHANDWEY